MNNNILYAIFILQKARINKQGKCPIRCRITYQHKRKEFSTGLFTFPESWNSKRQLIKPPDKQAEYINSELSLIKQKIDRAFLMLKVQERTFTVDDIYFSYLGKKPKEKYGVLEYYKEYQQKRKKLIGIELTQATWNKFEYIKNDLTHYIKTHLNQRDIMLVQLDIQFINDFEYYLKTEKRKQQITVNKNLQRFKSVVNSAVEQKLLNHYPFAQHKPKRVKKELVFLTVEELKTLEQHTFGQLRLQQVKDMFIFCCYTGLAYQEMAALEKKHIVIGFDGNKWIKMTRKKTHGVLSIPLLPLAKEILQQYDYELPVISNQKFNSYLKEIADVVGIEKRLTHHIARKTFATTVLLYNDVPMEIVSELLGHSKISITQEHYAKVVQKKVSSQMQVLADKLKP
ncbi:site-specific integrase [Flagellimonas onchidii]|uniref:site-specific integrase n=1 Tax=Flagellimonas onchidii TaxID=2562684 RepID=UPI0010A5AD4D|nr:site-specific integrase [Allomuricauda onchidii]